MCDCSNCNSSITSTQGPKGETGATGATGATGPQGAAGTNGTSGTTPVVSAGTGTTVLLSSQSGSTVLFTDAAGGTAVLPSAPAVGTFFDFAIGTTVTSNSDIIKSTGTDVFVGAIFMKKAATIDLIQTPTVALTDNTITLTPTVGGLIGTDFRATYTAANKWTISGQTYGTVTTTPFSTI
ncbi:hypothetical protein CCP3SC1AL1_570015 [Gammaproteobacteria bacterium]